MARHSYNEVTPETEAALEGFVKQVAKEMEVSPQYLHAILGSESADPFAKFLHLFRAVCRKNPEGARGYIARLNVMLRDETPQRSEAMGIGDAAVTFGQMVAAAEESPERFEVAKQTHAETVERVTVYAASFHTRNAGG